MHCKLCVSHLFSSQSRNGEVVDEEPLITHRVEEDDMLAAQTESTESEIRKKLSTFKVPPACSDGKETASVNCFLDRGSTVCHTLYWLCGALKDAVSCCLGSDSSSYGAFCSVFLSPANV